LVQKVATPSLSLLQRCLDGKPTFIEMSKMPASNREVGEPCEADVQCRSGLQCQCQGSGGKECSRACVVQGVVIPPDGEFHNVNCFARCKCTEDGVACVDMCPDVRIDCPAGQQVVMIPPVEGSCCSTPSCEPVHLDGDCTTDDVTVKLTFGPDALVQSYAIGTAQVDVGLSARCCVQAYSACGSKSYNAPYPWVISKENYLKSSGYGSTASIDALGLSIGDHSDLNNQPTPVKLGSDVTTVLLKGGGFCGEGRVLGALSGDQGIYGSTHVGPRFDELSLSFADCFALCARFPTCAGVSWKPERGLHLDGNCVLRGQACTTATETDTGLKFYPKGA